jgi:hypothetical protein
MLGALLLQCARLYERRSIDVILRRHVEAEKATQVESQCRSYNATHVRLVLCRLVCLATSLHQAGASVDVEPYRTGSRNDVHGGPCGAEQQVRVDLGFLIVIERETKTARHIGDGRYHAETGTEIETEPSAHAQGDLLLELLAVRGLHQLTRRDVDADGG